MQILRYKNLLTKFDKNEGRNGTIKNAEKDEVILHALYLMDPLVHFDCSVANDGILWDWRLENDNTTFREEIGIDFGTTRHQKRSNMDKGKSTNFCWSTRVAPLRPIPVGTMAHKSRNSGVNGESVKRN
jgi:hypothetical protein